MVKAPADKRALLLVPEFCFSPPFCLLNFILSYSTWIIISLLLVFYPHSVHCISSSFVFSFVLIPHNSLAFFSPSNKSSTRLSSLLSGTGKLPKSEIHFSSTCLFLCLLFGHAPGIHHHLLALFTWSFYTVSFLFSTPICFKRMCRRPPLPLVPTETYQPWKLVFGKSVSQLVPNYTSLFLSPYIFTVSYFSTGSLQCLLSIHCCLCPQLLGLTSASVTATETVLFAGFKANWVLSAVTAVFWVQFSSIVFKNCKRSARRQLTWLYL